MVFGLTLARVCSGIVQVPLVVFTGRHDAVKAEHDAQRKESNWET